MQHIWMYDISMSCAPWPDLFISHYSHVFDATFVGSFNAPLPPPSPSRATPIRHVVVIIYGAKEGNGNKTLYNV